MIDRFVSVLVTLAITAMLEKAKESSGFLAALDQSGGSTPKALAQYGVPADAYIAGEESMFDIIHSMRTRIVMSKSFTGDQILGAILFKDTMDREIDGVPFPQYLLEEKNIIPFVKCDQGLDVEEYGVQLMKPMPDLDILLERAKDKGVFGTKMRSVIKTANEVGIRAVVDQQFEIGKHIIEAGLMPIIEPEVDINAPDKEMCEDILKANLLEQLDRLAEGQEVMLKLSLPSKVNHYKECADHPRCIRVLALSGGYSRSQANEILAKQTGMIASFSRALTEGLTQDMSDEEFDEVLAKSIASIFEASIAG